MGKWTESNRKSRERRRVSKPCKNCKKVLRILPEHECCSRSCATKWRWRQPKLRKKLLEIAASNGPRITAGILRSHAENPKRARQLARASSRRMKRQNPIHMPGVKDRILKARRASGHWAPSVRGGNGHPPPVPERRLAKALGRAWKPAVVPTGKPRGSGWPGHYKIDLANAQKRIAIEVDGHSHHALTRKAADKRKDRFLRSCGWYVLRFRNEQIMNDLASVVRIVEGLLGSTTSK
jgi:Protein of unknown function (DUF559)